MVLNNLVCIRWATSELNTFLILEFFRLAKKVVRLSLRVAQSGEFGMQHIVGKRFTAIGLPAVCGAVSVAISPWMSLDPINLPKLLVLVIGAFALAGFLFMQIAELDRESLFLGSLFVIVMALVVINSDTFLWDQFYGTYGRNTGFLTYLALTILFLVGINFFTLNLARNILIVLLGTGLLNLIYGYIQWLGFDPINWNNKYNPIIGTLGNPNFLSAHLGFTALVSTAFMLKNNSRIFIRVIHLITIILSLVLVYKSDSIQGLAVFAIGLFVIAYFRFFSKTKIISIPYLFFGAISMVLGILGTLQIGPLTRVLYQDSVTYRGDYWQAGIKMTLDNPFLGVGMDSYGDWYRFSRSLEATTRRGPDVVSNSAHNVFLDISSNGGFMLLLCYLIIFGLVVRSIFRLRVKLYEYDVLAVGLVVVWFAYVIQSVISINQIGLAVWGWVIGGVIVGYSKYADPEKPRKNITAEPKVSSKLYSVALMAAFIGLAISIWPLTKDSGFRKSLTSRSITQVENAAARFPLTSFHFDYASSAFAGNEIFENSLKMAKNSVEVNPRNFSAWRLIFLSPIATEQERRNALENLRLLDPNNQDLKSQ